MKLTELKANSIPIGAPLPFALRDADGTLLAHKGFVIETPGDLEDIVQRGRGLYVDESEHIHRAYIGKLYTLLQEDTALGQIASTQLSSRDLPQQAAADEPPDWLDLQTQTNSLLRDNASALFFNRLNQVQEALAYHTRRNPDGTLFALFHLSASEVTLYSATHAMLVSVICSMAAREVLQWPPDLEHALTRAALTMNIGMTDLQDRLAQQTAPPTPEQRKQITHHAARSVQVLKELGITDAVWLDAVRDHHGVAPGPLADKGVAQRIARLIQRADMFAARLAPRASRFPISPAAAMQATYFDENRQVDEAGSALIKAVGIYSPGSFVRLSSNEVAVVVRRGADTTTPRVAVLINRSGMPIMEPIVRDTGLNEYRIAASVPHRDVKIKLHLQRMLTLTTGVGADRPW
jgi:HD-GYP domain-containing protein (c-di-GMP phosphodiesterase class II)